MVLTGRVSDSTGTSLRLIVVVDSGDCYDTRSNERCASDNQVEELYMSSEVQCECEVNRKQLVRQAFTSPAVSEFTETDCGSPMSVLPSHGTPAAV